MTEKELIVEIEEIKKYFLGILYSTNTKEVLTLVEKLKKESAFKQNMVLHFLKESRNVSITEAGNMSGKCYKCIHRGNVPGDTHSCCSCINADVVGDEHGIKHGWFFHPYNFDPIWLRYCDSYKEKVE